MEPINWQKLCEDSHNISKDKGWLDTERSYAGLNALMHSELAEALEDYRANRPIDQIYFEVTYSYDEGPTGIGAKESTTCSEEELKDLRERAGVTIHNAKPCGVPIELADFIIRVAQHCGTEKWALPAQMTHLAKITRRLGWGDFEEMIAWTHFFTASSFAFTRGVPAPSGAGTWITGPGTDNPPMALLASAVCVLTDFCEQQNPPIDLQRAVALKEGYNRTRSHRHGNKKI